MFSRRTDHADALAEAGERGAAEMFADAEARQRSCNPRIPLLYSVQGYRYCDLLLAKGEFAAARDRAMQIWNGLRG